MFLPSNGWANKNGTGKRDCKCSDWQAHWIQFSSQRWPAVCSVDGCKQAPTLGAHIHHPKVIGEKIVPMCHACNALDDKFSLKNGVSFAGANPKETCDR